jgi:hypothetical protein
LEKNLDHQTREKDAARKELREKETGYIAEIKKLKSSLQEAKDLASQVSRMI